jgi:hypothetical protein
VLACRIHRSLQQIHIVHARNLNRVLEAEEDAFVREVLQQLPMEFMAETQKLIGISLEGSVG